MPNSIKYTLGSEINALKKGNFYIGTGNESVGPTSVTGYWNGITPSTGGYVIYLNKSSGGPSIYKPANDSELINITNLISGNNYTTAIECLAYFGSQSDKMCFNRDYENIVTDGLVLNLDAGFTPSYPTSGSTWYDLSGNTNNGTLTNGPTFDSGSGGSIVFDGTNDYVNVSDSTSLDIASEITEEVWVYINSYTDRGTLITKNSSYYFQVTTDGTVQIYTYWNNGGSIANSTYNSSTNTIPLNTWTHIAFTESTGGLRKIYINGSLDSSHQQEASIYTANDPVTIGGQTSTRWLDGKISQARVYNKELTSTEILQNYNAQKHRYGIITDSLVLNLDAGDSESYPGTGSTWFDLSGNDNDGTLINGVGYDSSNGGSLTFDGTNDYVEVSYDADSFNIGTGDFSFNIWYYPDNNVSYRRLFSIGLFQAAGNFAFERQNGSNVVVHINGTFNAVSSSNSSGSWYNYTVTRESGLVKVYKNGAYVTQFTKTDAITNTNNILIAKESSIYFDGKIPITHFYKKALSASEVLYNHNTLKGRFGL